MRALLLCGCASLLVAPPVSATTYHVAPDSSGDVLNIQAAIDAATSGDEIVLTDGMFTGDGNWDLNFGTKELVLRSENGYEATIIDCGFDGFHDIRHRGVILEGGQTSATVIEGITFQRSFGNADGGSIRCVGASPVIRGVRIHYNRTWGRGGGVFVQGGSPVIEDCVFGPNYIEFIGGNGEAIFGEDSWLSVQRCSFTSVRAWGAVVHLDRGLVTDCTFAHCGGTGDHQGKALQAGRVSILRCAFRHTYGSAVGCSGEVLIGNCLFEDNEGDSGVGVSAGQTTIRNTTFRRNTASFTGIVMAGSIVLDHCVFVDNATSGYFVNDQGGVVVTYQGSVDVSHCTFARNLGGYHGGSDLVIGTGAHVAVEHSIFAFGGNATYPTDAIHCFGTPASIEVTCADIFGNLGGDWTGCLAGMETTNGNLSADPLFCDVAAGDLSLQADSPCAPAHSDECGLIGALGPWCGPLAVEPHSWGSIKALYR